MGSLETRGRKRSEFYARVAEQVGEAYASGGLPVEVDPPKDVVKAARGIRLSRSFQSLEKETGQPFKICVTGSTIHIDLRNGIKSI